MDLTNLPTSNAPLAWWIVGIAFLVLGFLGKMYLNTLAQKLDRIIEALNEIQKTLAAQDEKNKHFDKQIENLQTEISKIWEYVRNFTHANN